MKKNFKEQKQTRYLYRKNPRRCQQKPSRRQLSVIFIVQKLELDSFEGHLKTKDDTNEKLPRPKYFKNVKDLFGFHTLVSIHRKKF